MFSMHQKTPKYCFFFFGSNSLYGSSYMSSCPRQLHYSWQLKHYLGPHNHRAVHMTYCLLAPFAGLAPTHKCMQSLYMDLDVLILPSDQIPDGYWATHFPKQVYICHDSGLTRGSLLLSNCTKAMSPTLHIAHW